MGIVHVSKNVLMIHVAGVRHIKKAMEILVVMEI